jgi:hypothetical protein
MRECEGPVVPLGVCPTLPATTTLERTYTQSLVAGISLVRAAGLDPPQTPANLTRLARGSACYISGAGSSNDSSILQSNRRRLIETFGYDYNFYDGSYVPCPVVTNVEELYASGGLPSAVMQRWLNNSTSADVLGSDYTAVGVGVFAGSPTKYVAIFVTVEDYTEIDTSLCPASKDDEFSDL